MKFNEDGSVREDEWYKSEVLAYPKYFTKKELNAFENSYEYDNDYTSFYIDVTFLGKVYLVLDGEKFLVNMDSDDKPYEIHYGEFTLN